MSYTNIAPITQLGSFWKNGVASIFGWVGAICMLGVILLWALLDWAARPTIYLEPNGACIGIIEFIDETPAAHYCGSSKERGAERVFVPYGTTLQSLLRKAESKKS